MESTEPGEFMSKIEINSYKNKWLQSKDTGNYIRVQKSRYAFEWLDLRILREIPKIRGVISLLGRKPQGVDYYKYYSDILENNNRGKWQNEFIRVKSQIESLNYKVENCNIIDISGEPGFFAQDANELCKSVEVTAFAEEVSTAMKNILNLNAKKYDFQTDDLTNLYENESYDYIFIRYAIGFCEDLNSFVIQCHKLLRKGGIIYISFSPASRGVCARWMFDDYTYLRQFTATHLTKTFIDKGLEKIGVFDEGSFKWDEGLHPLQKLFSKFYTKNIFSDCDSEELFQHNQALLFKKN